MKNFYVNTKAALARLKKDEEGASLIEYSILIGLITAATVTAILAIAPKITTAWTTLNGALP